METYPGGVYPPLCRPPHGVLSFSSGATLTELHAVRIDRIGSSSSNIYIRRVGSVPFMNNMYRERTITARSWHQWVINESKQFDYHQSRSHSANYSAIEAIILFIFT